MKWLSIVLIEVTFIFTAKFAGANQGGFLFEKSFVNMGSDYLDLLDQKTTDNWQTLVPEKRDKCIKRYETVLNDGLLDIRVALGYFDWTTGYELEFGGTNFGLSPSLDLGAAAALEYLLLNSCYGKARFCGFKQNPQNLSQFTRDVEINGKIIHARITLTHSSATEYLNLNLGSNRSQQAQQTQYMQNFFRAGLQSADAIFYFGHSRNGGGPDFSPPVFMKGRNKVDYEGYYQIQMPGLKLLLSALQKTDSQAPIIALMSCASREHFLRKVRAVAPRSGVITSMDVLTIDEVFTAMIGGVDALLRGQCQASFYQSLRMTEENKRYITMDGMFE